MSKKPEFTPQEQRIIAAVDNHDIFGANLASLSRNWLTHTQNVELGENIQRGLIASRRQLKIQPMIHELALGNAGLAVQSTLDLASQVPLTQPDKTDCLQNSLTMLLKAAKKYDPWFEKKPTGNPDDAAKFATLAVSYILGGLKSSELEFQAITLPRGMADRTRRYRREFDLGEQLGNPLDHLKISEIVAQKEGLKAGPDSLPTIAKNLQLALNTSNVISLDDPCLINVKDGHTGESIQIEVDRGELLAGQTSDFEEDVTNRAELKKEVRKALQVLTDREKEVLELRFGLLDGLSHTREEIGHQLKSTVERIRTIETKALTKLRHPARSRSLREYL